MKKNVILLILMIFSLSSVRANGVNNNALQPHGVDLGEYAFSIPVNQLNFTTGYPKFTLSFWVNINEFDDTENYTSLLDIRNPSDYWPLSDFGLVSTKLINADKYLEAFMRPYSSAYYIAKYIVDPFEIKTNQWIHFSFVFDYLSSRNLIVYVDGIPTYESNSVDAGAYLENNMMIMIGGTAKNRSPLNAYIDKIQLYNKALSGDEVAESMTTPLLSDESLLGFWDFEDGCTSDSGGFMKADNGEINATMYKVLTNSSGESIGTEIQPFVFGEGVDPESVIQGIEENVTEAPKTKAYVSNGVLNIENIEGINSVEVYDIMGRVITSVNANGATSTQIALPLTIKGVIMVKVNNEVIKVVCNN